MNSVVRSDARPASAPPARRRRRPSGEAPPLPRHIGATGRAWLLTTAVVVAWLLASIHLPWVQRVTDRADAAVLRALAELRTSWLTAAARGVDRVATSWTMFVLAMLLMLVSILWKRWRHLFAFLGSVVVLRLIGLALHAAHRRPRPYDVTTIGTWNGYSSPSATSAIVSIAVIGVIYTVVVPGRPRSIAKIAGAVLIAVVAGARLYLAVDHPFDVIAGVALGVTVPLLAFRYLAPSEVVAVSYDGGKKAHLDITGPRGAALRRAVEDQLGAIVTEVRPVGLAGSGGSTPLRLRLAGDPETFVFGKLYALNHVRSDRWYKLGRFVLYGGLEDEAPFPTVRRLVQYEDYALRLMRDAGIATAAPLGIVELTPEREYMLVTEFIDGAEEIGDAEIDDQIIDEGLALVRRLWDAGLAHRDIKPANLLVVDGHLVMIDVAFAQVRPSPWRQAVDLANMMLVLAVRTDASRVYDRALTYFSPDEIAEAFAAARGVASPSQLRTVLKRDRRDLVAGFRLLGPARAPISLQRWGPRRIALAAAIAAFGVIAAINVVSMIAPADLPMTDTPTCGTNNTMILMAKPSPAPTPSPASMPFLPAGPSAASPSGPPTHGSGSIPIATAPTPCRSSSAQPMVAWSNPATNSTSSPVAGNRPSPTRRRPAADRPACSCPVQHAPPTSSSPPSMRTRWPPSRALSSSNLAATSSPMSTNAPGSHSAAPSHPDAPVTRPEPTSLDATARQSLRPPSAIPTTSRRQGDTMTSTSITPTAGSTVSSGRRHRRADRAVPSLCSAAGNEPRTCVTTRPGPDLSFGLTEPRPPRSGPMINGLAADAGGQRDR